jgi:hypothetical protein
MAALLPLGSLIYRYCSTVNCQEDETVQNILRVFVLLFSIAIFQIAIQLSFILMVV